MFSKILSILVPQEKKFFPLFERASKNLMEVTLTFKKVAHEQNLDERANYIKHVAHLEIKGDEILIEAYGEVLETFITPFDREDIHNLFNTLDDIIDNVHGACKRINLYGIDKLPAATLQMAEILEQSAVLADQLMSHLKDLKKQDEIRSICNKMKKLESDSDEVYNTTLSKMFREETNAIELFKMNEFLTCLETAVDKCEDLAKMVEGILVKNA